MSFGDLLRDKIQIGFKQEVELERGVPVGSSGSIKYIEVWAFVKYQITEDIQKLTVGEKTTATVRIRWSDSLYNDLISDREGEIIFKNRKHRITSFEQIGNKVGLLLAVIGD